MKSKFLDLQVDFAPWHCAFIHSCFGEETLNSTVITVSMLGNAEVFIQWAVEASCVAVFGLDTQNKVNSSDTEAKFSDKYKIQIQFQVSQYKVKSTDRWVCLRKQVTSQNLAFTQKCNERCQEWDGVLATIDFSLKRGVDPRLLVHTCQISWLYIVIPSPLHVGRLES